MLCCCHAVAMRFVVTKPNQFRVDVHSGSIVLLKLYMDLQKLSFEFVFCTLPNKYTYTNPSRWACVVSAGARPQWSPRARRPSKCQALQQELPTLSKVSLDPRLHKVYTLKALDFNLDYRDLCVEQFQDFFNATYSRGLRSGGWGSGDHSSYEVREKRWCLK